MINKNIKLFLFLISIGFSIFQFTEGLIGNGIMYLLISLLILFLFFKNEFLLLSFFQLRKQNLDGANKWLNKIIKEISKYIIPFPINPSINWCIEKTRAKPLKINLMYLFIIIS